MTVSTQTSRADYTGNGVTTSFAVPFYFLDNSHLTVLRTQISTGVVTTLVLTTDYGVTGAGVSSGGAVICTTAPSTDQKLSILRSVPLTQLVHYVPNDPFPAATHEQALDQLTMEVQQVNEIAGRALTLPANTTGVSAALPTPSSSKLIGWNSAGTGLQNVDISTLATQVAYGTARYDLFSGTGSQTAFTLTANPGAIANLDVSISGVTQRHGIDFTWTSGVSLTFTSAPPAGTNNILVRYLLGLAQGTSDSASAAFVASGTGAVTRVAQDKLREVLSVKDFGAVGNGSTDDTAAIQAALDAVKAQGGGILYMPPGTYRISTYLSLSGLSNLVLFGAGVDATIIQSTSATADVFQDSGTSWWRTFRDFSIASTVTRTAGSYFNLAGERRALFDRIRMTGHFNGFRMAGFEQTEIRSCSITKPSGAGTGIICGTAGSAGQGANLLINSCFIRGQDDVTQTNTLGNYGIAIYDVDAVFMCNTDVGAFLLTDVLIAPNTRSANHYFTQCWFDATQSSNCVTMQGAGTKQQITFTGCWFASAGKLTGTPSESCGMRATNTGAYQDMNFVGCRFYNSCGPGVLLEMPTAEFTFTGCNFYFNGVTATSLKYGLWWAPASVATVGPVISGCRFSSNSPNDIRFEANSRNYSVVGCNVTAGISNAGTGGILSKNPGYNPVTTTPTVTGSPYSYTNTSGDTQTVAIAGGTVSNITLNGVTVGAATNTTLSVPNGSTVVVTYTVAPTIYALGT